MLRLVVGIRVAIRATLASCSLVLVGAPDSGAGESGPGAAAWAPACGSESDPHKAAGAAGAAWTSAASTGASVLFKMLANAAQYATNFNQ